MCCFHPSYGYEDFIEGFRPQEENGQLFFKLRDGVFKTLCNDADKSPDQPFYLIIDEINRGDIPRIFGELMTVLEKSKRGDPVLLPLSDEPFHIPPNVYIIATMNTADRSIALLDTALRRRFGFKELMPDTSLLENAEVAGIPLGPWLDCINKRIVEEMGYDARNRQIGHTYLLDLEAPISTFTQFAHVLEEDIIPLLEDYFHEDYAKLGSLLGEDLIDRERQTIKRELFEEDRKDELVQALLAPYPEIKASSQALAAEAIAADAEIEADDDESTDNDALGA